MSENPQELTRRALLKRAVKYFFVILGILSFALTSLFLYPWKIREKKIVFFYLLEEYQLPARGVKQVYVKYTVDNKNLNTRVFVVNSGEELFALSPVCTHLGCLVNWNRHKEKFLCPCHGGEYDIYGKVVQGPPPTPLSRLPLKIENEKAFIGLRA